jgi:hypothetical protein
MMSVRSFFQRLLGRGDRLERKIDRILELQETTNMTLEQLAQDLDTETNAIAAKMDKLSADLAAAKAAGQAPAPETIAALEGISARLKALGSDPAAPIPAPATDPAPAG